MNEPEYPFSIIMEFRYGLENDDPFLDLNSRLHERWEHPDAPGKFDGNEISIDNFDARLYFYTHDPQKTLSYADDIFKDYPFLIGARIYIRHGNSENAYTETEIIAPNGTRTALSRLDENQISKIPEWGERERMHRKADEGDEWKQKLKNERAEKLYNQWKEIDFLIEAIWDKWDLSAPKDQNENKVENDESDSDDDDSLDLPMSLIEWHRDEMGRNSMIIPAKISGAEAGDIYILRMENAAIIRKAAMDVYLDCHMLREGKVASDQDIELLRSEIRLFREYFKEWVNGFEHDAYEDDWGLFLQ